jgi:hypothetical protein
MLEGLVGRSYAPSEPFLVSAEKVREFATATGSSWTPGARVPATFPIILAGAAMNAFLADTGLELSRIIHGEQRFEYARPVAVGDVLTSTFSVASLRSIGGNDIIGTATAIADASGSVVCTARATLIHRGDV